MMFRVAARLCCQSNGHHPLQHVHIPFAARFEQVCRALSGEETQLYKKGVTVENVAGIMQQLKTPEQADELLALAKSKQMATDSVYKWYLVALANFGRTAEVFAGIKEMIQNKIQPPEEVLQALTSAHRTVQSPEKDIHRILDSLSQSGLGPQAYHHFIKEEHSIVTSMKYYNRMLAKGVTPFRATYYILMDRHIKHNMPCKGLFDEMIRLGITPTVQTFAFMAHSYKNDAETCKKMHAGMEKRKLQPNSIIYGFWMNALAEAKDWEWVKKLWKEMQDYKIRPRTEVFIALTKSIGETGDVPFIQEVFLKLRDSYLVDEIIVYNGLLTVLASLGEVQKCLEYFAELQSRHSVKPNAETFDHMIQVVAKNDVHKMLYFEGQMRQAGFRPSSTSYHVMLPALAKANNPTAVLRVVSNAEYDKVEISGEVYLAMLDAASGPQISKLITVWSQELVDRKIAPEDILERVLQAQIRCKDVPRSLLAYEALKHAGPVTAHNFDLLLSMCSSKASMVACTRVLEESRKANVKLSPATYNALLAGYGTVGDLPMCRKLAEEMQTHQISLDKGAKDAVRKLAKGGSLFNTLVDEVEDDGPSLRKNS